MVLDQPKRRADIREALMVAVYHERSVFRSRDILFAVDLISETQYRCHGLHPALLAEADELLLALDVACLAKLPELLLQRSKTHRLYIAPDESRSGLKNVHFVPP